MSCLTPTSLRGALAALAADPGALVLAGGTDVMVEVNMGHRKPVAVVCVARVAELRSWLHDPVAGTVRIGAGVTYAELMTEPLAALLPAPGPGGAHRRVPADPARRHHRRQRRHGVAGRRRAAGARCAGRGGPPGIRARPARRALRRVRRRSKRTVRQPDELITAITVPVLSGWQGYAKVGVRNAMVIATATCCLAVDVPSRSVRIALGSVGPVILRATDAEAYAVANVDWDGGRASAAVVAHIGELAAAASRPIDDHRSTADYRRHAIGVLAARLARRAFPDE